MPFNPALPANGAIIVAAELRAQFTGLADQIAAIPAGPPGPNGGIGPVGPPFANAIVDSVTTVGAGENAQCSVGFDGTNVHFYFSIPRGHNGTPGEQGIPGTPGNPGEVTNADLANAISSVVGGSSANSNGVAVLLPNQPNPTILDVANKLDELIQALRR